MRRLVGRLWAPWRSGYILQTRRGRQPCIFCTAKRSRNDRRAQVVYRGRRIFCLLNRYPYNNGHLMVTTYRHIGQLSQLTEQEAIELFRVTTKMTRLLTRALRPHGFNLGINLGRLAGAGIPGHLHLHVVPRWVADTNFMPVIGNTKIISQSLEALYAHLKTLLRQPSQ